MPDQHGPAEFAEVLNAPEQPLIVGGQAVNVWAEYFAPHNPMLARQRPFVSKDADILGDRKTAQKLADTSGWQIRFFHEPRTIAVAVLTKERKSGGTLTVEVLREVRGLTRKELDDADIVELRPGQAYRIPSPIRLLKAKIANLREIKPARPQDLRHAGLLVSLVHDYLVMQHAEVMARQLSERTLINAFHEMRKLATSPTAAETARRFDLRLQPAIPLNLATDRFPKLAAFYKHHGSVLDG
jgi:hypothetical protein